MTLLKGPQGRQAQGRQGDVGEVFEPYNVAEEQVYLSGDVEGFKCLRFGGGFVRFVQDYTGELAVKPQAE